MKDFGTVFNENINLINNSLSEMDFASCFRLSGGLTHFLSYTENAEYIFVSEVLESVFSQVGPIIDNVQVPDDEFNEFMSKMKEAYSDLIIALEHDNKIEIFDSLVLLRFIATQFQLKWQKLGKPKQSKKGTSIPLPVEDMMKKLFTR
jgi:hypothetical protein